MFPEIEIRRDPLATFQNVDSEQITIVRDPLAQSQNIENEKIRRDPLEQSQKIENEKIWRDPLATSQNVDSEQIEIVRDPLAQFKNSKLSQYLLRLNWTQIQRIMRVSNPDARVYYIKETVENMWSSNTLDRNISTLYYQRLLSSQIKEPVITEMQEKTKIYQQDKYEFIKNPAVLEFLALPDNQGYTESVLEQAINNNMQKFLLELGKGFAFVARQQLVRTDTQDFYIDLVFYNYLLNCFVIIELKTHKITHQDIGQLDMYVRMYDKLKRKEGDNPTIGILLCTETDQTIAQYSVLNENKQLFASKYMEYLPTEEELIKEIIRQKEIYELTNSNPDV
jgi:predicted nuclease of restriction endonuclease-like (RecB) superfamily